MNCFACTSDLNTCFACHANYRLFGGDCLCTVFNCIKCENDPANKCDICNPVGFYLSDDKSACIACGDVQCVKCNNVADPISYC